MSNKASLVTIFSQGAVPQGTDFANLINSSVNMSETALQTMSGPLQSTEFDAATVSASTVNALNGNFVASLATTCDVSANANTVYCSATKHPVGIVSAVGTAQATAAQLTFSICRGQGTTDGQATGFGLLSNRTGWMQYLKYEGTVSANLWPPLGGTINNLSTNIPFPLAGGVTYTIIHVAASAYGVK